MFTTPANAPHHLTFLRFAARVPLGTQSCVSRLRVPSVRGGQSERDQSLLQTTDSPPLSVLLPVWVEAVPDRPQTAHLGKPASTPDCWLVRTA